MNYYLTSKNFKIVKFSDENEVSIIEDAMDLYRRKTCVRFIHKTDQHDYLYIEKNYG